MLLASCRRHFDSSRWLSPALQFRNYPDPAHPYDGHPATWDDGLQQATGQRVCVIIHGYNNSLPSILEAYADMQVRMTTSGVIGPQGYGLVIGFAWPGWTAPAYAAARATANRAGLRLRPFLQALTAVALAVDVEAHSLGCRVVLSALRRKNGPRLDNLLLAAAAVDHSILEPGRMFHSSLDLCERGFVYYSRRDEVLRRSYPVGDLADGIQKALGCTGPRRPATILRACPNLYLVDCTTAIGKHHSGYRTSAAYWAHWYRVLVNDPLPQTDVLAPKVRSPGLFGLAQSHQSLHQRTRSASKN